MSTIQQRLPGRGGIREKTMTPLEDDLNLVPLVKSLAADAEGDHEQFAALAQETLARIRAVRTARHRLMPTSERRLNLRWHAQPNRKGGRRSFAEYEQRAREMGLVLPKNIGWQTARDTTRALEMARAAIGLDQIIEEDYGNGDG
jgi:hypothetical protein